MKERLKDLLRRVIRRARVSPNPVMRGTVEFAQQGFRFLGLIAPGLHLGWMSSLRDVRWDGDDLVLRGWSFVRGSTHGGSPRHEVYLRRPGLPVWLGGRAAKAITRHVPDRDVLGGSARAELDYSGSTWEARFSAAQLAKLSPGRWDLYSKVVRDVRRSWGPVRNTYVFGTPTTVCARPAGDHLIRPVSIPDGAGAYLEVGPRGIPARSVLVDGRDVSIDVPAEFSPALGQAVLRGTKQETVPLTAEAYGDRILLTGTLPVGKNFIDPATGVRSPARWSAFAESGAPITDDSYFFDGLMVRPAASGAVEFVDVPHMVVVAKVVRDGNVLRLTGSLDGDPDKFDLVLAAARAEIPVSIDEVSPDGHFVATAPLRVSTWGGPQLPPKRGAYSLEGRLKGLKGEKARFATFVTGRFVQNVPTIDSRDDLRLRFELNAQPQLLIRVTRPRAVDEYGAHNQRGLFNEFALGPAEPLDAVYFESFFGRSATCNPRAIDAEVTSRRPDLPRYWSVDDGSIAVPDGAIPLVIGTREWWRVRESARWIVTNEWLRGRYVKKPFQTVLQTWHGSMYKRIGMDRGGASFLGGGRNDRARAERANWDMFISQNADTTPIIQQAYEFQGADASAVLEIGYPRNDELAVIDPDRVAMLHERIGIPAGRRVIMYAPTWREASQNVELLSLVKLAKEVGEGFTFLQRGHVRTLEDGETVASDAVIDVSTYPQINELFMVADLLITDYSSMMFDYSVTGRPMLFYTPDIEEYTDPRVRGAYFDLEEVAPGPVVRTVPEVVDLLRTIDAWAPTFIDRSVAWQKRFNHHDDGHASARAADALFAFDASTRADISVRRTYEPAAGEEA
ncbi:MAG TPA: CDP-glycerol glycerophosphotransferase family protein [Aeromicrobium sp.]|nr:CDP-glycerol glycerophosphotransferase family protein [Aeromicrobium sp.]